MTFIYRTTFNLTEAVINFRRAYEYLLEDDMTKYLLGDERGCKKVICVQWILETESSGIIEVKTSEELTEKEKANISSWISGQNSDGLGEGFEQQDFANYYIGEEEDYDSYYDEDWVMASFDWETNDYDLKLVDEIED